MGLLYLFTKQLNTLLAPLKLHIHVLLTISSHAMPIDHQPAIEVKAVVVCVMDVACCHPCFELLLTHHFSYILKNELTRLNSILSLHSPALQWKAFIFQLLN